MAEKKRKTRDETRNKNEGDNKIRKQSNSKSRNQGNSGRKNTKDEGRKKKGPRLPNALKKEINEVNRDDLSDSENERDYNVINDVYEYEETLAEEESKKNRRYDPVDNFEYELPEEFKDEDVPSDDEDIDSSDEDDTQVEDDGRHSRMLQEISGLPSETFEPKRRKRNVVVSEAYPESEYNPTRDVLDGDGRISVQDLLDPIREKSGFSKLRKNMNRMEKKSMSIQAPLPKPDQQKLERKAAYGQTSKDITKWNPLIKKNREATTLYFDADIDLHFSTVGAIASEFEPRTDFEKKMALLVNDDQVAEAHKNDGAKLLELNKISIDDVKNRQEHLAKMRSLLFRHEMKSKRIKKIKSKTYRNLLKKDRMKAAAGEAETDPEAAKELARNQEFKRAEERLTLKHKNSSKWAKRIIKRGLSVQDEGTRTAISDQLHEHTLLTRKMRTMKEGSSSDDTSDDEDDDLLAESDEDGPSKLLEKAKEKTQKLLEDDELPKSGVFSLPFMARGLKKKREEADEEARLALQEYELSLKQLEDKTEEESIKNVTKSGRRVFGVTKKTKIPDSSVSKVKKSNDIYGNSDSEDEEVEAENEDNDVGNGRQNYHHKDVNIDPDLLRDVSEIGHDPVFKGFEDIAKNPGPKTTYDVAVFASDSWKKKKNHPNTSQHTKNEIEFAANTKNTESVSPDQDIEEMEDESDTDGEGNMVDGILTASSKSTYELPSQTDLIKRAFAGDDVENEFEKDKEGILNEENPEPEKPVLLPGWGQWTHIQKKKGLPSWMLEEHANAKKKRDEALKKRKDANLKHVIISEKIDKKAEKLHTKTLPFPFTSKEVFEQSIRMPIGPEFNPVTAIGDLNRPEVVKKAGVIIKPIKYKELNSHEKGADDRKRSGHKHKNKGSTKSGGNKLKKEIKS